jgi:ABC-2 type transport system ATP-binding protein
MSADSNPVIRLENVTRWYGNVVAINDITYDFQPGISGILGPNGAGKSTLLHLMSGFLQPSSGRVLVFDEPAWDHPDLFQRLGLVPESEAVYPFLSAREFATISARLHGLPDPAAAARLALQRVELEDAQDRLMQGYSKGMRQRAKIAASLVHDPQLLILDEPFNGTDPRLRLHLMELFRRLAREGRTIIFSSHILEEVERLADEVLVILDGRLAAAGDFHQIRRLMTDRPHAFTLRSSDDRLLASRLFQEPYVAAVAIDDAGLEVRTTDFNAFSAAIAGLVQRCGVTLHELRPSDESLESVFSYLVRK